MERHLAGMLLRAATEHVTGTSNDSLAEEAHDSDPHAVDDHGVVDDHGAADGGHGPWWRWEAKQICLAQRFQLRTRSTKLFSWSEFCSVLFVVSSDSSELVFTSDVTLIPMVCPPLCQLRRAQKATKSVRVFGCLRDVERGAISADGAVCDVRVNMPAIFPFLAPAAQQQVLSPPDVGMFQIVLCVTFEWIHHKLMHWCTHADPAVSFLHVSLVCTCMNPMRLAASCNAMSCSRECWCGDRASCGRAHAEVWWWLTRGGGRADNGTNEGREEE
eukprot:2460715-Rhodomonas_salina.1